MLKTAEYVSLGHPDKTADFISCYILDRMIEQDKNVKYAVKNLKCLPGEKGRKDELGNWDCHIHTTMYKIDN